MSLCKILAPSSSNVFPPCNTRTPDKGKVPARVQNLFRSCGSTEIIMPRPHSARNISMLGFIPVCFKKCGTWIGKWMGISYVPHIEGLASPRLEANALALFRHPELITSSTAQGGGGSFKNRKPIGEVGCCESGMAERSHWWTERCLRSPLFRSLSLTIYLPTYLPIYLLCIYLSIDLSISLSLFHLSICLSVYLSIYLSLSLSLSSV